MFSRRPLLVKIWQTILENKLFETLDLYSYKNNVFVGTVSGFLSSRQAKMPLNFRQQSKLWLG